MIVTCPSCATRYLVDPAALGEAGRTVRCARCAHTWMQPPPDDMPRRVDVADAPAEAAPIPPGSIPPAAPEGRRGAGWLGWAALAVVIAGVLGGAVLARDAVVAEWPLAARLYAMAGLVEAAPAQPLTLRNVTQSSSIEGERLVVVVTGEIVNESATPREIPSLVAKIVDKDQRVLKSWVFDPKLPPLGPGESTAFTDRFEDPPEGAATVTYDWPSER